MPAAGRPGYPVSAQRSDILMLTGHAVAFANDLIAMEKRGFRFVGPTVGNTWVRAVGIVNNHHAYAAFGAARSAPPITRDG